MTSPLQNADRILILGPCGAGKSTLGRSLGDRLGLPVVHLDQEFWRPGWVEAPDHEFDDRVRELVAEDRWIIEGNFIRTLPLRLARADLVIHLDYGRRVFMPRLIKRISTSYGSVRADMGPGCPERLDWSFLRYAWRFPTRDRHRILDLLRKSDVTEIRIVHPRALQILGTLRPHHSGA